MIAPLTPNSRSYLNHFTQPDTIIPDPNNPADYNRYGYARYNPVNYTDPSGHIACNAAHVAEGDCDPDATKENYLDIRLARYGIEAIGNWTDEYKETILASLADIGQRLRETVGGTFSEAFKATFIPMKFVWVEGPCGGKEDSCYADAFSFPNTIKFYSQYWRSALDEDGNRVGEPWIAPTPALIASLVVHELGHAFDIQTERAFDSAVSAAGIDNWQGFGKRHGFGGHTEVAADLFLNYIYGSFTGPGSNNVDLSAFMTANIAEFIGQANSYDWPR